MQSSLIIVFNLKKFLPHIAFTLFVTQLLVMLVSWLLSAAFPNSGIRSLLSGEGLRWFFGHFTLLLATPIIVWLLLLAMAYGVLLRCGVLRLDKSYRASRARIMTFVLLLVYVGVIMLMVAVPHAVLLSATGSLWPSPFSQALIPFIAFGVIALGAFYGIIAGSFNTLADVYDAVLYGILQGAPFLLFYVLLTELYQSLLFILGI